MSLINKITVIFMWLTLYQKILIFLLLGWCCCHLCFFLWCQSQLNPWCSWSRPKKTKKQIRLWRKIMQGPEDSWIVRINSPQWYFVTKIVLNYCEKKLSEWSRKTFEIRGWRMRICKKFLRSLEQFIQTVNGQNNFW